MNEEQKRVNDYYENLYGKGPLKPEGELRERIAELEAQVAENKALAEKWGSRLDEEQLTVTKLTGENANLKAQVAKLEREQQELVYNCRDWRIKYEALREAAQAAVDWHKSIKTEGKALPTTIHKLAALIGSE